MDTKTAKFDDTETEKHKFDQHESPISISNIDINKIVVSNRVSFGEKWFYWLQNIRQKFYWLQRWPLCILLPKVSAYRRDLDETRYVFFHKI